MRHTELSKFENRVGITVFKVLGCRERGASRYAEAVEMLMDTMRYVEMNSIKMRPKMKWAMWSRLAEAGWHWFGKSE